MMLAYNFEICCNAPFPASRTKLGLLIFHKPFRGGVFMAFTRNIGFLCLAIYLILIGLTALTAVAIPPLVTAVLALVAGILIILGV